MKKRLTAMLLVVMMLVSVLNPYVFADSALAAGSEAAAQFSGALAENVKLYLGVTAGSAVSAVVTDDYGFEVDLPEDGKVSTNPVSVEAKLQNVAALGLEGVRAYDLTVDTGLGEITVDLKDWLSNAYDFENAKLNVSVDGKSFSYAVARDGLVISGTTDEAQARAAWLAFASHLTANTQPEDDSYVSIAKGSYIKLGTEYLRFEENSDDLKLDNVNDRAAIKAAITEAAVLETCEPQGGTVTALVKAGTKLAVGQTVITLNDDYMITVEADAEELAVFDGALAEIRDKGTAVETLKALVEDFNKLISVLDACEEVNVTVHRHALDQKNTDARFLAAAGSCTKAAEYYYSCTCGEMSTETFKDENYSHKYLDGVCTVCGELADNVRAYVSVVSGSSAYAVITDDYNAVLCLPMGNVNLSNVVVKAAIQDVSLLGIGDVLKDQAVLDASAILGESILDPKAYIPQAYAFKGGTLNASVDGNKLSYTLSAIDANGRITATVTDKAEAIAALKAVNDYFLVTLQDKNDSKIVIAKGSYAKVGTDYYRFEDEAGDLVINSIKDEDGIANLLAAVLEAVKIDTCENAAGAELFVKQGTTLACGNRVITLDKDCLITVTNEDLTVFNVDVQFSDPHVCVFDQQVASDDYLASAGTCQKKALYYYSCTCGKKGTETFEGSLGGHVFDQQVATDTYLASVASCTEKAMYYYSCLCGEKGMDTFEYGSKLPHKAILEIASPEYLKTPASCTAKAVYYKSCVCGAKGAATFQYGELLPHTFDQQVASEEYLRSAVSCTAKATYYYSCICGEKSDSYFEYGNKLSHNANQKVVSSEYLKSAASCTSPAVYYYSCICGEKGGATFTYGTKLSHSFTEKSTDPAYLKTPASCTSPAVYYFSCVCGEKGAATFEYGGKLPHSFTEKNTDSAYLLSAGDCLTKSVYYYSCVCGEKGTETFEAGFGPHDYNDGICTLCGGFADNVRFYLAVRSGSTVSAMLNSDFSALFTFPTESTVNTGSVSVFALLKDIESLGVVGSRSHKMDVDMSGSLGEHDVDLKAMLPSVYNFGGGVINANIVGYPVKYTVSAIDENGRIVAATDSESALLAWNAIFEDVTTELNRCDDSRIVIQNGSYIKIGTEYLRFENESGSLVLDDINELTALKNAVKDAVVLDTCDDQGGVATFCLKKGSQLAIGGSLATLDSDTIIKISVDDADEMSVLKGQLTALRDANNGYEIVKTLVSLVDKVVGLVDSVEKVNVDVDFHKHVYNIQNTDAKYLKSDATCTSPALYYYSCDCGRAGTSTFEYGAKLPHTFDQQVADNEYLASAATCQNKATYYYSCTCGEKGTETFEYGELAQHVFDKQVVSDDNLASEASCTEKARYFYTCVCGEKGTDTFEFGVLAQHVFDCRVTTDEYLASAGTCIAKAQYYYSCTCGLKGSETYEGAFGTHNYVAVVTDPGCETGGYTTHTCSYCLDTYVTDETDALGHNYDDGVCTRCKAVDGVYFAKVVPTVSGCRNNGKPQITWKPVNGATKYIVYRATSKNGTYTAIYTTTKTTYRNTSALLGRTYYYKVQAVAGDYVTEFSRTIGLKCILATPEVSVTSASGKPKVVWNEVKYAQKYYVYRSTDGVNFSFLGSTENTSFTNFGAQLGTTYYYKVKAVRNDLRSFYSPIVSKRCTTAAPIVNITRVDGVAKLSWNKVDNAAKYWIFRSTDGKNFEYYRMTKKLSFTDTKAQSGVLYYYKVKAVAIVNDKNISSSANPAKSLFTTLTAPTIKAVSKDAKPYLSWDSVQGAAKYYIYRSTDGKTFSYYSYTKLTHFTDKKATVGCTYYYKVKAICGATTDANSLRSTSKSVTCRPLSPQNVAVNFVNDDVVVSWDKVPSVAKYWVYRSVDGGSFKYVGKSTDLSYTDSTVSADATVSYKVKAVSTAAKVDVSSYYSSPVTIELG